MSKVLRWIILAIIVLMICDWVIISYWRDDVDIDVSASTLTIMLIGLPLAIILGLYLLTFLFIFVKNKLNRSATSLPLTEDNASTIIEDSAATDPEIITIYAKQELSVLETALVTPFGDDATQIMTALQKNKLAEPDPILKFQKIYPYLSRRIQTMPALNDQEKIIFKQQTSPLSLALRPLFTDRAKRVEQITTQLFEQLALVLQSIHVKKLYPNQEQNIKSANQIRMHPEWISQADKQTSEELPVVYRPSPSLRVLYILPTHISDVEAQVLFEILKQCLNLLDLSEQHDVSYHISHVETNEDTQKIIHKTLTEHLNRDHINNPQLLLIMGVDSWIDQLHLDIKFDKEKEPVHPSEGGFAILFADQEITTDIEPIASVTAPLMYKCQQCMNTPDHLMAENLIQSIQELQKAYNFGKHDKILADDEIVFVDHGPIQMKSSIDLISMSNHFQMNEGQIVSISSVLNDTAAMASTFSLILAIKNTIEKQRNTLVINNAGSQLGTSWMIVPPKKTIVESDDAQRELA